MTAKGATSSLNKGRRGLYRVTATASLAVAAMSAGLLRAVAALRSVRQDGVSKAAVFANCERPMAYKRRASTRAQNRG